jgi:hypothetical protein
MAAAEQAFFTVRKAELAREDGSPPPSSRNAALAEDRP